MIWKKRSWLVPASDEVHTTVDGIVSFHSLCCAIAQSADATKYCVVTCTSVYRQVAH
jgi:hypothetical protein